MQIKLSLTLTTLLCVLSLVPGTRLRTLRDQLDLFSNAYQRSQTLKRQTKAVSKRMLLSCFSCFVDFSGAKQRMEQIKISGSDFYPEEPYIQ